jgi:hypothetical protein
MQITRKNWGAVTNLIHSHGIATVDRMSTLEQDEVYCIEVAGMTYTLPANLACDLLIERKLSDVLHEALVSVGFAWGIEPVAAEN